MKTQIKRIVLLMFLIVLSNLQSKEFDLDYFSLVLSKKYNKTVIMDKEVVKTLKVYGDIIKSINIPTLNLLLKESNYRLYNNKDTLYIQYKPEEEAKQEREEKVYTKSIILEIPYSKEKVNSICETVEASCVYLKDYKYFISYKSDFDISTFSNFEKNSYIKKGRIEISIVEINIDYLKEHNVDITSIFSLVLNNEVIPISLIGSFNSLFTQNTEPNTTSVITVNSFIKMLEGQGKSNISKVSSFPLLNENKILYSLGDTQQVKSGSIQSEGIVENTYKEINTGLQIEFDTLFLKEDILLNLKLKDNGTITIDSNGTYSLNNTKEINTKLVFNEKNTTYYIPFNSESELKSDSHNPLLEKTFFSFLSQSETNKKETKQIFISFKYLP